MTVTTEINGWYDLKNELWSCEDVIEEIDKQNRGDEAMEIIEELFSDGADITSINDFVRFDLGDEMSLWEDEDDDEEDEE